jgi:hypothetical protein
MVSAAPFSHFHTSLSRLSMALSTITNLAFPARAGWKQPPSADGAHDTFTLRNAETAFSADV